MDLNGFNFFLFSLVKGLVLMIKDRILFLVKPDSSYMLALCVVALFPQTIRDGLRFATDSRVI